MPNVDRLTLAGMVFQGRHGVLEHERAEAQRFVVDVEMSVDAAAAASDDDITRTVDYAAVFEAVRRVVEEESHRLIETLAEAIARALLVGFPLGEVEVRVRKPDAPLPGTFDYVEVAIRRSAPAQG